MGQHGEVTPTKNTNEAGVNWPLVLDYVSVFVWPVLVIAIAIGFRHQIRSLFDRPPTALQLPGGTRIEWAQRQQLDEPEPNPEGALAPYEDEDFVEALREEVRAEVQQEAVQDRLAVIEHFVREQVRLQLALEFERVLNRIFGSQIRLLEWIRGAGLRADLDAVNAYFVGVQQAAPALVAWNVDQYVQFLLHNELLRRENDQYIITDKGQAFLGYLQTNGYVSGMRTL